MAFIVAGCDSPTSSPEPEQKLLDIPAYGSQALPLPQAKPGKEHLQTDSPVSPLYDMLAEYARQHPDKPYVAIVGIWNKHEKQYRYKTIPLSFPDSIKTESSKKNMFYRYKLSAENGAVIRNLAALAPRHADIPAMMKHWLQPANLDIKNPQAESKKENQNSDYQISGDGMECVNVPSYGYYCWFTEDVVVTADTPEQFEENTGGGGTWPSGGDTGGCPDPDGCSGLPGGGSGSSGPPATAPDGVPQDYYKDMNDVEKEICYDNKYKCIGVYHASVFAEEWAAENEVTGAHNGPQDALRHAMWSAKMAYAYGEEYAKKWGDAHEIGSISAAETHMDQHNNQVGRSIGGPAGRNLTYFPDVEQDILDARDNGDLCLNVNQCN